MLSDIGHETAVVAVQAQVLVFANARSAAELRPRLEKSPYEVVTTAHSPDAIDIVRDLRPAVVVIGPDRTGQRARRLTKSIRGDPAVGHTSILVLVDAEPSDFPGAADDIVDIRTSDAVLLSRVRALVRRNTIYTELLRRRDTINRFGLELPELPPSAISIQGARVLMVGTAEGGLSVESLLDDRFMLELADDLQSALDLLVTQAFDAVVVDIDSDEVAYARRLIEEVRNVPSLYDLPLLAAADTDALGNPERLPETGITDLVIKPIHVEALRQRVAALVRQRRFDIELRLACARASEVAVIDHLTGLYSFGFLHEHLATQIAHAERYGGTFSLILFDVCDLAELNRNHGYAGGDKLLHRVGEIVGRLVRVEDLPARHGGGHICIVLPDTPTAAAALVAERLSAVVENTDFLLLSGGEPVRVRLAKALIAFEPGDTPETLLERAYRSLE